MYVPVREIWMSGMYRALQGNRDEWNVRVGQGNRDEGNVCARQGNRDEWNVRFPSGK